MSYITGKDRGQLTFMPECIEDLIDENNPVRVIDSFVNSLSLAELGFIRSKPADTGRPGYDPKDLLKLYIYGYFNGVRSSRKLMRECARNIELFFLLNFLIPDFRTIADFRKDNAEGIRKVFLEFVKLSLKLKLYQKELIAIDGSKFLAVNGRKRMYNDEILAKKIERIDGHLQTYLTEMDRLDKEEGNQADASEAKQNISGKQELLSERKKKYQIMRKKLKESGETQLLTTDPEARMMKIRDGYGCAYNVQTAVDDGNNMIADYLVINDRNDEQILSDFASRVKETLSEDVIAVVADKGYDSKDEIEACVFSGVIPYVGFKNDKDERIITLPFEKNKIASKLKNSVKPDDIKKCLSAGILPACYENSNISVEVNAIHHIGCFTKTDDKTVLCPMGQTLKRTKFLNGGAVFARKPVCRACPNRCTPSKNHRTVYFGPDTEMVVARMYGKIPPVNKPPKDFTPHNSFFIKPIEKTVTIRIKDDIPKQKKRLCISEHPFGTIKRHHGAYFLLCKGIKKTTAEIGLSFLVYNLKRAINIKGVNQIIAAINEG